MDSGPAKSYVCLISRVEQINIAQPAAGNLFLPIAHELIASSNFGAATLRPLIGKLALASMSLIVALLAVEGLCRMLPAHRDTAAVPADDILTPDPELVWRLKPQSGGPFATNALGLRDTPYQADATFKILLLGDSVSWGDGIHDPRLTYPWLLEKRLSEARGVTVEVINSAVPGYSTFQEFRYLQLHGLSLKPDLIIIQFCLNDVIERYSRLAEYGGDNIFIGIDTRHAIRGLHGWLLRNSRAYETGMRFAVRLARNQQEYQVEKLTEQPLSPELTEAWARTLSELDQIGELAAENRIPVVLLMVPYRFQLERPELTDQPQQLLQHWASSRGIPMIDLLPQFTASSSRVANAPMFFDPSHLTIEGHQMTAEITAAALLPLLQ